MVAALELYLGEISQKERGIWEGMVAHIVEQLEGIPHVKVWRQFPYRRSRDVPIVVIEVEDGLGLTVAEILERMLEKDPPIYAYAPQEGFGYPPGKGFILNPHTMREGEEAIVADRLREILLKGREYAAQGKVG